MYLYRSTCLNDLGELSAIGEALMWLRDYDGTKLPTTIYSDSKYAAETASGEWNGPKNRQLASHVQALYKDVNKSRRVGFEHVKGHSDHPWNDRADKLANRGNTSCCTAGRFVALASKPQNATTIVPCAKKRRIAKIEAKSTISQRHRTQPKEHIIDLT